MTTLPGVVSVVRVGLVVANIVVGVEVELVVEELRDVDELDEPDDVADDVLELGLDREVDSCVLVGIIVELSSSS